MIRVCANARHLVDQALRGAHTPGGHHHPLEPEPVLRERHGSALGADEVGDRHADVRERDDRVLVGDVVRILRRAHHLHTRPRQVDDQQHVITRMLAALQHGLDEDVIGEIERRDVPLGSVDDVLVTGRIVNAARGGLQPGNVGAGELLGDRVRLVLLAAHRRQQPALALVLGGHVDPPLRRRGHHPGQPVGDPPGLFLHQHLLQRRASRATHRRRHVGGVQAQFDCPSLDARRSVPWAAFRPRVRPRPRAESASRRTRVRCPGCVDPRAVSPYIRHPLLGS